VSEKMDEIQAGQKYFHYKNPNRAYEIIGLALHSETMEELVIYKALYEDKFPYGQIWARPKKEFLGKVTFEGKEIDRFRIIK
jgi:hypothetical protein